MANFYGQYTGFGAGGGPPKTEATGGTIDTSVAGYKIHTFNTGADFVVTSVSATPEVEYLVIAGCR